MAIEDFFNQLFKVDEPQRTATGKGGQTQTWRTLKTGLPGSQRPASAQERLLADQQSAKVDHVLYVTWPGARRDQRFTNSAGRQYMVSAVRNPGGLDEHYEIDAYEIQRGG